MSWSYDPTTLGTSTSTERLNSVRYLVGDTDTSDQQVQDEEITFALTQVGDNIFYAASFVADNLSAKFSRLVNTKLDGALSADYSDLAQNYRLLASQLRQQGQRYSGTALGISFGGITVSDINTNRENSDRVEAAFRRDRFRFPDKDYATSYEK